MSFLVVYALRMLVEFFLIRVVDLSSRELFKRSVLFNWLSWDHLLIRIMGRMLKRDVLVEEEVASDRGQRHVTVEHHPVDLLALLQP